MDYGSPSFAMAAPNDLACSQQGIHAIKPIFSAGSGQAIDRLGRSHDDITAVRLLDFKML
jgi:hypothetical protein